MRETENTAYARKREFLLCTDICGSALDTLRSRQEQAYCPALVEVFELEEHAQEARRAWMSVALESRLCASHSRGPPCRGWTAFCIGWRAAAS